MPFEGEGLLIPLQVQQPDGCIISPSRENPAIGTEGDRPETTALRLQNYRRIGRTLKIPHPHGAILSGRCQPVAAGLEGYRREPQRPTAKNERLVAGSMQIPQPNGAIEAAGGQCLVIGAEGDCPDPVMVPAEDLAEERDCQNGPERIRD